MMPGRSALAASLVARSSGSSDETKNVLIECAYFDPQRTAATGRRLGLMTDARYRFERGVDPASVLTGLDLATDMILKLVGGEPSKVKVAGKPPVSKRVIAFDFARVEQLTGLKLKDAEIKGILEKLGCALEAKGEKSKSFKVTVPTWRPDIHGPADLVEEVVRIAGIDRVPATPLARTAGVARPVLTEQPAAARGAPAGYWLRAGSSRPSPGRSYPSRKPRRSAAARPHSSLPIRSRRKCRRCARACCRGC